MKHDQRLVEFYARLGQRNGVSPEILLHEARLDFRKAWRRDLLAGLLDGGRDARKGASATPDGRARRLRLDMENAWLWLYYQVEDDGDRAPGRASGSEGESCRTKASAQSGYPVAARIQAAKNGCDRLASIPIREGFAAKLARILSGGGEPGRGARYILGPR